MGACQTPQATEVQVNVASLFLRLLTVGAALEENAMRGTDSNQCACGRLASAA